MAQAAAPGYRPIPIRIDERKSIVTFQDGTVAYYPLGQRGNGYLVADDGWGHSLRIGLIAIFFASLASAITREWIGEWSSFVNVLVFIPLYYLLSWNATRKCPVCPYHITRAEWRILVAREPFSSSPGLPVWELWPSPTSVRKPGEWPRTILGLAAGVLLLWLFVDNIRLLIESRRLVADA